jgi:hypothetical protein
VVIYESDELCVPRILDKRHSLEGRIIPIQEVKP